MKRYFRDFCGASASIAILPDDTARLIVYDGHGRMMIKKTYNTFRGARIAMGKYSDSWHEMKK